MWRPRSYADIQAAIGVVAEDSQLDFKATYSKAEETAKDVAGMTIEGGVLAYGVEEQNGVASALPHVQLAGGPERIQQIIDTRIRPVPTVEIEVFPASASADDGVVVVTILPSPLAPHYANERFPARAGVTTRNLTEHEIDALYQQRRRVTERATADDSILAHYTEPEGGPQGGVGGIGIMRLLIGPLSTVRHPSGAKVGSALTRAVHAAATTMSEYVKPSLSPKACDWLVDWRPRGTLGWQAGLASSEFRELEQAVLVAATYTHSGNFSFLVSMGLMGEGGAGRIAFEHLWAVELMACLCIAGTFLADVPGVGLLECELGLQGLHGAVSWKASRGRAVTPDQPRITESNYYDRGQFGARGLARDPRDAARLLLDRLFASFLDEGVDIVADVAP
jgi:hypothetical protein